MTVAAYVRVSSTDQNLASQRREIRRWLSGNRIADCDVRWFEDKASGANLDRPAFEELQRAVFNGEVKTIVVYRLDRISRSLREGLDVLCGWCEKAVRVVAVTQAIDFNGTVGKLLASVLFAVAEMEREAIRERQAAGIAAARERGVYRGRKSGSTKAKPARARQLRERGLRDREIAEAMGVSIRTVARYLKAAG